MLPVWRWSTWPRGWPTCTTPPGRALWSYPPLPGCYRCSPAPSYPLEGDGGSGLCGSCPGSCCWSSMLATAHTWRMRSHSSSPCCWSGPTGACPPGEWASACFFSRGWPSSPTQWALLVSSFSVPCMSFWRSRPGVTSRWLPCYRASQLPSPTWSDYGGTGWARSRPLARHYRRTRKPATEASSRLGSSCAHQPSPSAPGCGSAAVRRAARAPFSRSRYAQQQELNRYVAFRGA